jgi:clan AA aspartic protease
MGTFKVAIQIGDPQGRQYESVEALVDTGASDTVVPRSILQRLGVPTLGRWPFTLADERVVEHEIGQTAIRINGTSRIVPAVFGESDATVLLGASSLEVFHLVADPVHKRLVAVTGLLMRVNSRS